MGSVRREMAGVGLSAGGGGQRQRCSGGGMKGQPGSEASVGRYEAIGEVNLGNVVVDRRRHGKLCSPSAMAGGGWGKR